MAVIILYLALLAAAFFVLVVRPQRRQLARRRALIASLEVGDDVITAGGVYGEIVSMQDTTVVLHVAEGVDITLAREAVTGRQPAAVDLTTDPAVGDGSPADDTSPTEG